MKLSRTRSKCIRATDGKRRLVRAGVKNDPRFDVKVPFPSFGSIPSLPYFPLTGQPIQSFKQTLNVVIRVLNWTNLKLTESKLSSTSVTRPDKIDHLPGIFVPRVLNRYNFGVRPPNNQTRRRFKHVFGPPTDPTIFTVNRTYDCNPQWDVTTSDRTVWRPARSKVPPPAVSQNVLRERSVNINSLSVE